MCQLWSESHYLWGPRALYVKYVAILNLLINVAHAGQGVEGYTKFISSNHDNIWVMVWNSRKAISETVMLNDEEFKVIDQRAKEHRKEQKLQFHGSLHWC